MSIITIIYLAIALLVFVSTLYNMIFKDCLLYTSDAADE